jgi:hypothetical protein
MDWAPTAEAVREQSIISGDQELGLAALGLVAIIR